MGHTTWEQVFSSRLAESANSATISASARQKPKAFAAALSKAARSRPQGCSALCLAAAQRPLHRQWLLQKSLAAAALAPQRRTVLTPQNSSVKTRLLGGSDDPLQGQGRRKNTLRTSVSLKQSPPLSKLKLNFHLNDAATSLLL